MEGAIKASEKCNSYVAFRENQLILSTSTILVHT